MTSQEELFQHIEAVIGPSSPRDSSEQAEVITAATETTDERLPSSLQRWNIVGKGLGATATHQELPTSVNRSDAFMADLDALLAELPTAS